jgi:hypothetical protein
MAKRMGTFMQTFLLGGSEMTISLRFNECTCPTCKFVMNSFTLRCTAEKLNSILKHLICWSLRTFIVRQRISKHAYLTIDAVFSVWFVQSCHKGGFSWEELVVVRSWQLRWRRVHLSELMSRSGTSSGDGSLRWLRTNEKKGIRWCKEDFMCDLRW